MENTIKVTACDNELIILAYQWGGSFELCRILSGNYNPVDVTLNIKSGPFEGTTIINGVTNPLNSSSYITLPAGKYNLLLLGIDWGGPQTFNVSVNGVVYQSKPSDQGDGLVWNTPPIPFTV